MNRDSFELRGKRFELSRSDVEDRLKHVEPKAVTKYQVRINGKGYPPKQALAAAIGKPVANFTTMDATRILSKLGFEVTGPNDDAMTSKTISEQLFEAYLNASGLTDFRFEPPQDGTSKRPDYSLSVLNTDILFELKQFDQTTADFNLVGGAYDPYKPVREKIESARKKFKDLERFCCCLVLYNNDKPLVELAWQFVYGAMLGNLGFSTPVNTGTGIADESQTQRIFGTGGKMYRYLDGQAIAPQNRTISAIVVLRRYMVGSKRFEIAMRRKENELGRKLELLEFWDETERARGTALDLSLTQLRVIVLENPFARIQLPRELFRGPYDERYAGCEGRIVRVFCGDQLAALEEEAREAELAGGMGNLPTKEELGRMHFSKLDKLCRKVAENPHASSVEADQARDLRNDMLGDRFKDIKDFPALGGKTVGETQTESLRRRVADFLTATSALWQSDKVLAGGHQNDKEA
jgi:hypothetical protein